MGNDEVELIMEYGDKTLVLKSLNYAGPPSSESVKETYSNSRWLDGGRRRWFCILQIIEKIIILKMFVIINWKSNNDRRRKMDDLLQNNEYEFNETELSENDLQLAENACVDDDELTDYERKRLNLKATKISRQTWSILETYKKLQNETLILNPEYQRNVVWKNDKKTAFIESLYMGIMIPPIYVVEVPGKDMLDEIKYEVVDGKQRLTSVKEFLENKLTLKKQSLEYYADIFAERKFEDIKGIVGGETTQMLSSILDIYVITASSPEETKYDIFARLNKGAEKLKVNEIRRAIYHSDVTTFISGFVDEYLDKNNVAKFDRYKKVFTQNDIKRYDDFGRFYRSVAYYVRSNLDSLLVEKYNSRPRDMINNVLQSFQNKEITITNEELVTILETTMTLRERINVNNSDYIIDSCIPFAISKAELIMNKLDTIQNDEVIKETLDKSPSTTTNVNRRLGRVKEILEN